MDPLAKLILVVAFVVVGIIYWLDWRLHRRHDTTEQHIKGVRVRLERHSDELEYWSEKEREEARKMRLTIYQQFREWLHHMRGK